MNFESNLFRPVNEIPDYVTGRYIPLQKAGMLRFTPQNIAFGPSFFDQLSRLQRQLFDGIKHQCVAIDDRSIDQVSLFVQSVRSSKALPLVLSSGLKIAQGLQNRTKTVCDQTITVVQEKRDLEELKSKMKSIFGGHWKETYHGFTLCPGAEGYVSKVQEQQKAEIMQQEAKPIEKIPTPGASTMQDLEDFLHQPKGEMLKLVEYQFNGKLVFIYVRGDQNVSIPKLCYQLGLNPYTSTLEMAEPKLLEKHGIVAGFGGFYGAKAVDQMIIFFDQSLKGIKNSVTGANEHEMHYINYTPEVDSAKMMKYVKYVDIAEDAVQNDDIMVELNLWNQEVPLMASTGKVTNYPIATFNIRWLEVLLNYQKPFQTAYIVCQVQPKYAEQYTKAQEVISILSSKYYCIVDERPKVTFGQKKDLAQGGAFGHIFIIAKELTEGLIGQIDACESGWSEERKVNVVDLCQ